eukprot:223725-Prorocentrum_minimum.AAC.1
MHAVYAIQESTHLDCASAFGVKQRMLLQSQVAVGRVASVLLRDKDRHQTTKCPVRKCWECRALQPYAPII